MYFLKIDVDLKNICKDWTKIRKIKVFVLFLPVSNTEGEVFY